MKTDVSSKNFINVSAYIRYNKEMRPCDKIFYIGIMNLARMRGYIWGSNRFLANHLNVCKRTIINRLHSLSEKGFIRIVYNKTEGRKIYIENIDNIIEGKPTGYINIDKDLITKKISAGAKLLYMDISSMCSAGKHCFAKNQYFASIYNRSKTTIDNYIRELKKFKYLVTFIKDNNARSIVLNNARDMFDVQRHCKKFFNKETKDKTERILKGLIVGAKVKDNYKPTYQHIDNVRSIGSFFNSIINNIPLSQNSS